MIFGIKIRTSYLHNDGDVIWMFIIYSVSLPSDSDVVRLFAKRCAKSLAHAKTRSVSTRFKGTATLAVTPFFYKCYVPSLFVGMKSNVSKSIHFWKGNCVFEKIIKNSFFCPKLLCAPLNHYSQIIRLKFRSESHFSPKNPIIIFFNNFYANKFQPNLKK